jgi:oxygen-independent coproporphyrinogen-3 oxidase
MAGTTLHPEHSQSHPSPLDPAVQHTPVFSETPPLCVYVHVPWCARKCPYCDFNSHEQKGAIPEQAFVQAVLADLEQESARIDTRGAVSAVFFGGGTPSLLTTGAVDRLLAGIRARLPLAADAEITLEANPGSVDRSHLRELRSVGVNRLSIGVQSFAPHLLEAIGRIHGRREAIDAVEAAHAANFAEINVDLMFALPGQSLAQCSEDVRMALALQPSHISYYQLTIEPNTLFAHRPPRLPDVDQAWSMQETGGNLLERSGYGRYEISAYARAGSRCAHNLNYWRFGDYLGIGPGAHSKYTDTGQGRVERSWKQRHPNQYIATAGQPEAVGGRTYPDAAEIALEFMMNTLRLVDGFEPTLFTRRTALPLARVESALQAACERGLLEWSSERIRPSARGYRFLNDLLTIFPGPDGLHE